MSDNKTLGFLSCFSSQMLEVYLPPEGLGPGIPIAVHGWKSLKQAAEWRSSQTKTGWTCMDDNLQEASSSCSPHSSETGRTGLQPQGPWILNKLQSMSKGRIMKLICSWHVGYMPSFTTALINSEKDLEAQRGRWLCPDCSAMLQELAPEHKLSSQVIPSSPTACSASVLILTLGS